MHSHGILITNTHVGVCVPVLPTMKVKFREFRYIGLGWQWQWQDLSQSLCNFNTQVRCTSPSENRDGSGQIHSRHREEKGIAEKV